MSVPLLQGAVVSLVSSGEVRDRLAKTPGLPTPSTWTGDVLEGYIRSASGTLLIKTGYAEPPRKGTTQRDALDDLCIRLVINAIRTDTHAARPDLLDLLLRERDRLLAEAKDFGDDTTTAQDTDPFLEVVDTLSDDD